MLYGNLFGCIIGPFAMGILLDLYSYAVGYGITATIVLIGVACWYLDLKKGPPGERVKKDLRAFPTGRPWTLRLPNQSSPHAVHLEMAKNPLAFQIMCDARHNPLLYDYQAGHF